MTKAQIELTYKSVINLITFAVQNGYDLIEFVQATEKVMSSRLGQGISFEIKYSPSETLSTTCSKTFGGGQGAFGFIQPFPGGGENRKCGVIIKYSAETQQGKPINDLQKWIIMLHEIAHTLLHYTFKYMESVDRGNEHDLLRETEASYFAKYAICNNIALSYMEKEVIATIKIMHSPRKQYLEADLPI